MRYIRGILSQPCSSVLGKKSGLNGSSGSATRYTPKENGSKSTTGWKQNFDAGHEEDPDWGGLHVQTLLRNQSKDDAVPYQDGAED
jgi:hypothetical protein